MPSRARVHVLELNANELKVSAIERGIRGYYKLNQVELIQALEAYPVVNE